MPIKMSFKSSELFHYFFQSGHSFDAMPGNALNDCVAAVTQDPYALRNILLIAGLHYAWNVGDLRSFKSTFLFHKIESIRTVNEWLATSDAKTVTLCVRHIATLCVVESCLGNFIIAETHLEGLMMFLESKQSTEQTSANTEDDIEREFADRAYNLVHSLKSRLDDFLISTSTSQESPGNLDPSEIGRLIHQWHLQEVGGLPPRLKAMRLFPFFFSPISPGRRPQLVDIRHIIRCLQEITQIFELRYLGLAGEANNVSASHLWDSGCPSRLLLAAIDAHIKSISQRPLPLEQQQDGLLSSWSGICVVVGLYLTSVLGVWNRGFPVESRLFHHILLILRRDLQGTTAVLTSKDVAAKDLWVWKAFIGAFSLAHAKSIVGKAENQALVTEFSDDVLFWARATGNVQWAQARKRLAGIAWPAEFQRDTLAELVWNGIVRQTGISDNGRR